MSRHTLSVLVEDQPGVLARISSLFARRGFNIESLAVGPTETNGISRMTIVVNVDQSPLEQVTKQLNKLINVLKIVELENTQSVLKELLLVKVKVEKSTHASILETVSLFNATVVDVAPEAITIEATGDHEKIQNLLKALSEYGIKEIVQSGMVAIGRGGKSASERAIRS